MFLRFVFCRACACVRARLICLVGLVCVFFYVTDDLFNNDKIALFDYHHLAFCFSIFYELAVCGSLWIIE